MHSDFKKNCSLYRFIKQIPQTGNRSALLILIFNHCNTDIKLVYHRILSHYTSIISVTQIVLCCKSRNKYDNKHIVCGSSSC